LAEQFSDQEGAQFSADKNEYTQLAGVEAAGQSNTEVQEDVNPNELRKMMDHVLQRGTISDLEALLDSGVDVNQGDFEGRTALMLSSAQGKRDVVEMLLARGADVNRVFMYHDRIPMSALDAARQSGHFEIADTLDALGAKSGKELNQEQ
jgi:ankyrin repeat protein